MNTKLHVKKGDTVLVISGDDRGKKGKVLEVSPKEGKVIVEGKNMIHYHIAVHRLANFQMRFIYRMDCHGINLHVAETAAAGLLVYSGVFAGRLPESVLSHTVVLAEALRLLCLKLLCLFI